MATSSAITHNSVTHQPHSNFIFATLTSLFFMWGLITAMNDVLIPHLKALFDLTYTQAMLVQSCFFGAYFLVSIPASAIVNRLGYQKGIGIGLITAALGCLLFIPSALFATYAMFLTALFVLAAGITLLQVAANPLVTIMGKPETASMRLTLTQAFNSLGTTIGPIIGGILLFSAHHVTSAQAEANSVIVPYLGLALILIAMALTMIKVKLPSPEQPTTSHSSNPLTVLQHRHLALGVIGIFLYVGAEVSIGSFLVNYLAAPDIMNMSHTQASIYLGYYWGGAMVGRFVGAAVMQKVKPGILLTFNCTISVALIVLSVNSSGALAVWSILAVGLFNSIMFPTIFSLALHGLGGDTAKGSGLLCLGIVGGAIIPLLQGVVADNIGLQVSFLLPIVCYVFIGYYGVFGSKPSAHQGEA